MSDEDALLRAICEQPDEDTPRLVFADWLQEQGGPLERAWANGIRAQVRVARGIEDALNPWVRLFASDTGMAPVRERLGVPPGVNVGGWERGFPSTAEDTVAALHPAWPRMAYRAPIVKLTLLKPTITALRKFATWPNLASVRELVIGYPGRSALPVEPLPVLAACAGLRRVEHLTVLYGRVTEPALTALLDSPHFVGLKSFSFTRIGGGVVNYSPETRARFQARFGYPLV